MNGDFLAELKRRSPDNSLVLVLSDDPGAILELDLTRKQLHRWDSDSRGRKFEGGINDIVMTASGGAYATGFGPYLDPPTPLVIGKILYLAPGSGKWVQLADDLNYANGIGVSPDQKSLYVSQTVTNSILKFTIEADGSLSHRSNFGVPSALTKNKNNSPWLGPDSMKIDGEGNIYVAQWFGRKSRDSRPRRAQGQLSY
jgi:sugar lactone lactonase YvrE